MDNLAIEKAAIEFRKQFDMDTDSIVEYEKVLEATKIITVFRPLSQDFAGMAYKRQNDKFMMINSSHSKGKQNFTICHEIYHLMIQEGFVFMRCNTELFDRKKDRIEYQADLFASHLLIPTPGILERIPSHELKKNKISLGTIVKVEQYFQCSRASLLFRLNELDIIDQPTREEYSSNVINSAKIFGFTSELYKGDNSCFFIGKDYQSNLEFLYENEKISLSNYLEMLNDIGEDLY
jgi:Zn-dependent peptidase ImmA (M78 family)